MAEAQVYTFEDANTDERRYEALVAFVTSPGWTIFSEAILEQYSNRSFRERVTQFVTSANVQDQRETSAQLSAAYDAVHGVLEWPLRQIRAFEKRRQGATPHRRANA